MQELILVDKSNNVLGYDEKNQVHVNGSLHRAFSIFIYNKCTRKVLLQKRANGKYHSGGKWSNSCCSHPYKGEQIHESLCRCVKDELSLVLSDVQVINYSGCPKDKMLAQENEIIFLEITSFVYFSDYGENKEHELDFVYACYIEEELLVKITPNFTEVAALKWIDIKELDCWLNANPEDFSSWFKSAYECFKISIA